MKFNSFSSKQLRALTWWCRNSRFKDCDAVICDGAIRSGKTLCMSVSFIFWAFSAYDGHSFALCGKTITSLKRNVLEALISLLPELEFSCQMRISQNRLEVSKNGRTNSFFLFGGRDESSSALIQGMTLSGVLFDEVALMPRSFVEQALARCSVEGSRFWFNCNPEHPRHWFHEEWIRKAKKKNALYIHFRMEDNPSLSRKMIERYQSLYSGTFYERFVEGKWVAAEGLVYPFMAEGSRFAEPPCEEAEEYRISCDYGTVNPASFGLWGLYGTAWYYFDSRKEGIQRTDEEHYDALETLGEGVKVEQVTVDPSAASFIAVIRQHGRFPVTGAVNDVLNGIRQVSDALKSGRIVICSSCTDAVREFGCYRWDRSNRRDAPRKEQDHAMDDIRYFVSTFLAEKQGDEFFVVAAQRK